MALLSLLNNHKRKIAAPYLIAVVLLAAGILNPVCAAEPDGVTPQARKDFEWFSTLGFPDPKGCVLVRVDTGGSGQSGEDAPREEYEDAFLQATNTAGFTVLTMDLVEQTYAQTNAKANGKISPPPVLNGGGIFLNRVGFDVLTPSNEVAEVLGAFQSPSRNDLWWRFGRLLDDRTVVFAMAWGCWRNGWDSEAEQLYEQVHKMPARGKDLGDEFAKKMYMRALAGFGDEKISRPQLLAQFQSVISNYPGSEYVEPAKTNADLLMRMISEDNTHARTAPTNLAQLPVEQQVSKLIFQLRDQTGFQSMNPGRCSVFDDPHGSTNTPAHQLARLGYAAVPQLIAALDDSTPSRAMGWWYGIHLTVGDCAEQILERIAGRNFLDNQLPSDMSDSSQLAATRKAVESWRAEFKVKGEKEMLVEGVTTPNQDTPAQTEMLCERYPDIAVATLIRGVQAATNSWVQGWLVDDLSKFDEPRVSDFLNHEMINAPFLDERVRAAYKLLGRERQKVVPAMIREWENIPKHQTNDEGGSLEDFLAKCDSVEAINALGKDLREHPAEMRYSVIWYVGDANTWGNTNPYSPATLNAMEKILVSALDDTEQHAGMTGLANMKTVYDPRICDLAGYFLAQRWPDRYVFDLSPSLSVRDRQRVECQNVWRRAHNQPALALPPPPAHRVTPDQATVVTAIEWATNSAKPSTNFAASVEAFRDKPLDAKKFVAFLDDYGINPEPQASGLELKITKDVNLTGVMMKIRLLPGKLPRNLQLWDFDKQILIDGKTIHSSGGGSLTRQYFDAGSAVNFTEGVEKALAAKPEMPFEIRFHVAARDPQ